VDNKFASHNQKTPTMPDLIELAKSLSAWTPKQAGKPVSYDQLYAMVLKDFKPANTNIPAFSRINGEIRQFITLFRAASPEERTAARRILREGGPKPIWVLLRGWQPADTDPAERLRLILTRYAITHRMDDYRDEAVALNALSQEAIRQGLEWKTFQSEYTGMCADDTSD
jgi:hypothetical protein